MGIAGSPEDIANAVAYVTGINLPVAGGVPYGIQRPSPADVLMRR